MKLMPVGIDIAKNVFQVHHVDAETGEIVNRPIRRAKFLEYFANRPPCLVGMEACGGAHHWARQLTQMGHDVRLKHHAPQYAIRSELGDWTAGLEALRTAGLRPHCAIAATGGGIAAKLTHQCRRRAAKHASHGSQADIFGLPNLDAQAFFRL